MKIAVTGSNGFVGSHLCEYLERKNYDVTRIQRKSGSNCVYIPKIDENTDWAKALKEVDTVIHCAAIAHSLNEKNFESLHFYRNFNVLATKKLAEDAFKYGVKRFIFISSIKVNGEKTDLDYPFNNKSNTNPEDAYSLSKLEAEEVLKKISKETGLDYVIIRPPIIYGPGVKANFFKLLKYAKYNLPFPFGKIKNLRSILYIGNLTSFIEKCLLTDNTSAKTFLVSDGDPLSTNDLFKEISLHMGKKPMSLSISKFFLNFIGKCIGKKKEIDLLSSSLVIDSLEIKKLIDWEPPYSTEEGLKLTVKWFLKNQ